MNEKSVDELLAENPGLATQLVEARRGRTEAEGALRELRRMYDQIIEAILDRAL